MSLLSWNILNPNLFSSNSDNYYGFQQGDINFKKIRARMTRVAKEIAKLKPDILLIQETNPEFTDLIAKIAKLNYKPEIYGNACDYFGKIEKLNKFGTQILWSSDYELKWFKSGNTKKCSNIGRAGSSYSCCLLNDILVLTIHAKINWDKEEIDQTIINLSKELKEELYKDFEKIGQSKIIIGGDFNAGIFNKKSYRGWHDFLKDIKEWLEPIFGDISELNDTKWTIEMGDGNKLKIDHILTNIPKSFQNILERKYFEKRNLIVGADENIKCIEFNKNIVKKNIVLSDHLPLFYKMDESIIIKKF